MFQQCISSFLIVLNAACVPVKNANASETNMGWQVQKTNVLGNSNAHAKKSDACRNIVVLSGVSKNILQSQGFYQAPTMLLNGNLEDYAATEANPQNTPIPGTKQKSKSKPKIRIKVVIITIAVLVGIAIIIGLADRKS